MMLHLSLRRHLRLLLLLLQLRLLLVVRKHARVRLLLVAVSVAKQTVGMFCGRLGLAIRIREQRGGVSQRPRDGRHWISRQ